MGLTRAQREAISLKCVEELENLLYKEKGEIFRTCDNMNTITWQVSEDNGKPIYGSIKFTLHKDDYDLDSKIEEFEYFDTERREKAQLEKEKKEKRQKEQKAKAEKAAAKKVAEEKEKKKRQEYLASIKNEDSPLEQKENI